MYCHALTHGGNSTTYFLFQGTSNWPIEVDYQTMLLIVPSKYAEESDIMGRGIKVLPK